MCSFIFPAHVAQCSRFLHLKLYHVLLLPVWPQEITLGHTYVHTFIINHNIDVICQESLNWHKPSTPWRKPSLSIFIFSYPYIQYFCDSSYLPLHSLHRYRHHNHLCPHWSQLLTRLNVGGQALEVLIMIYQITSLHLSVGFIQTM